MNPKEKILRTELVSAGAALLCCLLLCIGCTAFGRFRRVALGPGVHGIGAERRVYSSVSFRSSKKRSTNLFGPFFSFSVKGLPRLSADAR